MRTLLTCSILLFFCSPQVTGQVDLTDTVQFFIFDSQQNGLIPVSTDDGVFNQNGCNPKNNFTVVVHGWKESAKKAWVLPMLANFSSHRGGCVLFMQYGRASDADSYFSVMMPNFERLSNMLVQFLRRLLSLGFASENGFLFGFSFGGQMVLDAGRKLGNQKLARVDACEPAGPGFDSNLTYGSLEKKSSAKAVQCIFTSLVFSTVNRNCHINWQMGICGISQPAARVAPESDHGLCPYFYNSAFDNKFVPMKKPIYCPSTKAVGSWPQTFRMGYFCDVGSGATGDYYATTLKYYPYV
ncbi:uncharacterized protein LOC129741478 [Uranotaenia lowii]|uniref:uncharacterized protein LOC129741478 n=1 Tax=Uranotaenia lowii TaxID=190385 RepID=UPI00247B12FE|nr:uncharacterized protein LOC129741478 [Uranotaenia lowii]